MDEDRFDILARKLSTPSRRRILVALAAVLGGSTVAVNDDQALAKRKQHKHHLDRHKASHERIEAEGRKKKKKKKKKGGSPTATAPSSTGCTSDSACTTSNPCRVGRCAPADPARDANGCVFDPITGGSTTCGVGACQRTVNPRCIDGVAQTCVPGTPDCTGKECGDDGCGGSCGPCTGGTTCSVDMCCPQGWHKSCEFDSGLGLETCVCCGPNTDSCGGTCCPPLTCYQCVWNGWETECGCIG